MIRPQYTFKPILATLGPYTLNPRPWTLNPGPWSWNLEPWTLNPEPQALKTEQKNHIQRRAGLCWICFFFFVAFGDFWERSRIFNKKIPIQRKGRPSLNLTFSSVNLAKKSLFSTKKKSQPTKKKSFSTNAPAFVEYRIWSKTPENHIPRLN